MRIRASIFLGCLLYALFAVLVAAGRVPHDRLLLLAVEHAMLLPFLVVVVRRSCILGDGRVHAADLDRRAVLVILLVIAVATVLIARFWDRGILWGDEDAYRVQAQLFASGRLWADAPLPTSSDLARSAAELRFTHHIIHDGHWFTKYPPLWPAVLMVGQLAHLRVLVNPLLALVALWIIHRIAIRELELPNPLLAVVMLATSPFFFTMAASQMSHMLALACCAGAVLCFLRAMRTGELSAFAGTFGLIGACVFARPYTACCVAVGLAPFAGAAAIARPRRALRWIPIGGAVLVATVAGVALYNRIYTGHYGLSPYALYRGASLPIELSFAPSVIVENVKNAVRWSLQDTVLFMWPLVFALAGYAMWADRARRHQHAVLVSVCCAFMLSNLFQTEGSSSRFGDRYLFEISFVPVLLAARGVALLVERWRIPPRVVTATVLALTAADLVQAGALLRPTLLEIRPYARVHDLVDALPADGSLVFFPITPEFTGDRFDLNATNWRAAPHLFLVDPGPARRAAVAAAEGRSRWIVIGYAAARDEPVVLATGGLR